MSDHGISTDARVKVAIDGFVATITLDRPEKLNALDLEMVLALEAVCYRMETLPGLRVAIVTGTGDKAFCAGGDIAAWSGLSPREFGQVWVRHGHRMFDALARLRYPLIAVLNGHTLGGGLELAATADFRVAEQHIRIGQPETGLGIIPGWSGTQRLVRRFGPQLVRRMAIAGEVFAADDALRLGLVDQVTGKGEGLAAARALADRISARGPVATEVTKQLINAAEGEETERVLEAIAGSVAAASDDLAEGVAAFRAKRSPKFEGR